MTGHQDNANHAVTAVAGTLPSPLRPRPCAWERGYEHSGTEYRYEAVENYKFAILIF